jgi:dTMP kinase
VRAINHFAIGGTLPQLTLVLDMDSATAWQRIHQSGRELDRMESQPQSFFEKVRQGYLEVAQAEPQRIQVIDAGASPEAVHAAVWERVSTLLA